MTRLRPAEAGLRRGRQRADELQRLMLRVGIKYCGGCNPYYDRIALFDTISASLKGSVEFVSPHSEYIDLILVIQGCRTACADLNSFNPVKIRLITQPEDAEDIIREIQR